MPQLRERQQLRDHEVEERFRELVEREGLKEAPPAAKRRIRWMQWLVGLLVLALAGGVAAFVTMQGDEAETSTYLADPYAELEMIEQLGAEFESNRPYVYAGSAYAELEIIEQLVAEFEAAHPSTYRADTHAELALIDEAIAGFEARPSTYIGDPYAELDTIEHLVAKYPMTDRYTSDAYAELEMIEQAVAAFDAGRVG